MNTDIAYARANVEPETPDLYDVLSMVAKLHAAAQGSHEFDRLALALSAADVESMEGLVIDGEVYSVTRDLLRAVAA